MNDLYQHKASGAKLYQAPAFPQIDNFGDLFHVCSATKDEAKKPEPRKILLDNGKPSKMTVGSFIMMRDGNSFYAAPKDCILSEVKRSMIIIDYDELFFEIIDHENGWSLVVVSYNQIIGTRWLAYIKTKSIPANLKNKTKCEAFVPLINNGDYRGTFCCVCGKKESEHNRS